MDWPSSRLKSTSRSILKMQADLARLHLFREQDLLLLDSQALRTQAQALGLPPGEYCARLHALSAKANPALTFSQCLSGDCPLGCFA
jgi:hypothetical protein